MIWQRWNHVLAAVSLSILLFASAYLPGCHSSGGVDSAEIGGQSSEQESPRYLLPDQAAIKANHQWILEAAELVPRCVYGAQIVDGEPDLEYADVDRAQYNILLAEHADEIHRLLREVVESPAPLSLVPDQNWFREMSPEEVEASERCIELSHSLRRFAHYLPQEAARRVRAGAVDAATDSLVLLLELGRKCAAEPNGIFRLSILSALILDENYAPVLDRLTDTQRERLSGEIGAVHADDPFGLRRHAFYEAEMAIGAFESSLDDHSSTADIADRLRLFLGERYPGERLPGETFAEKWQFVLFTDPAWADAIEATPAEDARRVVARATQLLVSLERAQSDAELEIVLDEMIADETRILAVLLGNLPAIINGTWKNAIDYASLRTRLAGD